MEALACIFLEKILMWSQSATKWSIAPPLALASLVAQLIQFRRPGFDLWVGKILWRRERLFTPVFRPGEFHGLYSPWDRKELDMTERLSTTFPLFQGSLGVVFIAFEKLWNPQELCTLAVQNSNVFSVLSELLEVFYLTSPFCLSLLPCSSCLSFPSFFSLPSLLYSCSCRILLFLCLA